MNKRFYITTAIDYVNGQPHLGHAYEKVITDVINRAQYSLGNESFFLTGLDEHGQKVQQAALAEGKEPQTYCDELATSWQAFVRKLELSNNDFVRTSSARHKAVVQAILAKLHAEGHFYTQTYSGFYSTRQETFLTDKDRLPDGTFEAIYGDVVKLEEENWYFKMQAHQQWLIDYIEANPTFIEPSYRRNEVLGFLKNNTLEDLCITRPVARLSWGIPLPFASDFVTYVWFDALVNYISVPAAHGDPVVCQALGLKPESFEQGGDKLALWPADVHVIGKDILKFHGVYWPIMLKAMGLPLPKQILVHGWWQKDGEKISKATGNIVEPVAIIDDWGLDAFRYYVVRELAIGPDGNWTDEGFSQRYHADLAKNIGNLLNRSVSMLKNYNGGVVPAISQELAPEAEAAVTKFKGQLQANELQDALETLLAYSTRCNVYIEQTSPFKLKDAAQKGRRDEIMYNLIESCRIIAVLLWPFIPNSAGRIYQQLGLSGQPDRLSEAIWGKLPPGHQCGDPVALFPRRDQPKKGA
jgi:methionyl-tRNA synthetase